MLDSITESPIKGNMMPHRGAMKMSRSSSTRSAGPFSSITLARACLFAGTADFFIRKDTVH